MGNKYIIISPVHNEAEFIEEVIQKVVTQTIRPYQWLIMNDASTDNTGAIVDRYKEQHPFIIHYNLERGQLTSYYARRTHVFLAGYEKAKNTDYDFVAALDADLIMKPDYYENILREFDKNSKLGIASGVYVNKTNGGLEKVVRDPISTPGGLQMFRRECYEQIGGYMPLPYGGDDSLADILARMHGWQTHSFSQYEVIHLRPVGTRGGTHILKARFRQGLADYSIGTHPLFMVFKSLRRLFVEKPYFFGSLVRYAGYLYSSTKREKKAILPEVIRYFRKEQMERLRRCFSRF